MKREIEFRNKTKKDILSRTHKIGTLESKKNIVKKTTSKTIIEDKEERERVEKEKHNQIISNFYLFWLVY